MTTAPTLDQLPTSSRELPRRWWQRARWRFAGRVAEIIASLAIGMTVFYDPWSTAAALLTGALGISGVAPMEQAALAMVITMVAGAGVWMLHRGYSGRAIGTVAAVSLLSFLIPYAGAWAGWWTTTDALTAGHLLPIPGVVLAMIIDRQRFETGDPGVPRFLRTIGHRWPTLLALGLTFSQWTDPGLTPAIILVGLGAEYLLIGAIRRQFADRRLLWWQLAGFVFYLVFAGAAVAAGPELAKIIIGVGWLLHAVWDAILHRRNVVTWRWYAELCFWFDLVLGSTILLLL
jgi:hypothetical protein